MESLIPRLDAKDHSRDVAGMTYVYPVLSRRAGGVSIGINLNPNNACNWRCIYCQVPNLVRGAAPAIDMDRLAVELRAFLHQCIAGDYLRQRAADGIGRIVDVAISGNGEPTSAREFAEVVTLVGSALDEFSLRPAVRPRLITNGSLVDRSYVRRGIERLAALGGEVWFKVDAGSLAGTERVNSVRLAPAQVARRLARCAVLCPTWVQTCWFALDGRGPDGAEIEAYLDLLRLAGPQQLQGVLAYGLARPSLQPEAPRLTALAADALETLADRVRTLGLTVKVSP